MPSEVAVLVSVALWPDFAEDDEGHEDATRIIDGLQIREIIEALKLSPSNAVLERCTPVRIVGPGEYSASTGAEDAMGEIDQRPMWRFA